MGENVLSAGEKRQGDEEFDDHGVEQVDEESADQGYDQKRKRVFGLVIDFGTSQSPKSTRPLTTYLCPSRPGHQALRNNFASSLLLRTWLPYDWTPRSEAYFVFPLTQGTPGKQCGLAATGVYQPSLRSPWLAAPVWKARISS
ncbi:hypothetical protein [Thiolapillus sp.]|uniref:hypothetical protein n=1 Tax=Thiolapillus sp. TaxID=2017437 RepID=UPI003AF5BBAA